MKRVDNMSALTSRQVPLAHLIDTPTVTPLTLAGSLGVLIRGLDSKLLWRMASDYVGEQSL